MTRHSGTQKAWYEDVVTSVHGTFDRSRGSEKSYTKYVVVQEEAIHSVRRLSRRHTIVPFVPQQCQGSPAFFAPWKCSRSGPVRFARHTRPCKWKGETCPPGMQNECAQEESYLSSRSLCKSANRRGKECDQSSRSRARTCSHT